MKLDTCAQSSLETLQAEGLLTVEELGAVERLATPASTFAKEIDLAETIHLHIKVDNTDDLPLNALFDAGARLDHQKHGFVKYLMPGGVNAIFSHIKVSQDELLETESDRRPRPFLDHIGIDMRDETPQVQRAFDQLPLVADQLEWSKASQGGPGQPVYCCHVEVAAKHWLYPPDESGHPGIPLEFAYGPLTVNPDKSGCDLRPANPSKVDPASIPSCCGTTAHPSEETDSHGYYQKSDLGRFGEISRVNPELGKAFFAYYEQAMAGSLLSKKEKALIALGVAHALKCPYCIDAYTQTLKGLGVSEAEMGEAIHVSAVMAAGVSLVHSVQMMKSFAS